MEGRIFLRYEGQDACLEDPEYSTDEFQVHESSPDISVYTRVSVNPPEASNQAMQLTASKPDVYASGVCRRERMLRGMHRGSRQLILCLVRPLAYVLLLGPKTR
jgi:hypothetical protein